MNIINLDDKMSSELCTVLYCQVMESFQLWVKRRTPV